mgnify:CR=1 FL=1
MRFRKDMKTGAGLVRLSDGSLLSAADLPPWDTTRWVASRKLAVVRAVLYQLRTQEEVLETYSIGVPPFGGPVCMLVHCRPLVHPNDAFRCRRTIAQ